MEEKMVKAGFVIAAREDLVELSVTVLAICFL